MAISKFDNFIRQARESLRIALHQSNGIENAVFEAYGKCCGKFEEDTLIENLREEFENYCTEVAAG